MSGHTATPVTHDDQSKMGIRINGGPEPSNQILPDRMDSDIQAVRKDMENLGQPVNEPITDPFGWESLDLKLPGREPCW